MARKAKARSAPSQDTGPPSSDDTGSGSTAADVLENTGEGVEIPYEPDAAFSSDNTVTGTDGEGETEIPYIPSEEEFMLERERVKHDVFASGIPDIPERHER